MIITPFLLLVAGLPNRILRGGWLILGKDSTGLISGSPLLGRSLVMESITQLRRVVTLGRFVYFTRGAYHSKCRNFRRLSCVSYSQSQHPATCKGSMSAFVTP